MSPDVDARPGGGGAGPKPGGGSGTSPGGGAGTSPQPSHPPSNPPPTKGYAQRYAAYVRQNSYTTYTTRLTPRQLRRLAKKQRHQTVTGRTA